MSLIIHGIGGNCPVQAEGTVDGKPFYFRARGEHWAMHIGGDDVVCDPEWAFSRPYGDERFAAGWMPLEEALAFINEAVALYGRSPGSPEERPATAKVAASRSWRRSLARGP